MPRHATTESQIADTGSSMAARTSSGERMIVLGRPLIRSRPRTSALISSRTGEAGADRHLDLLGGALADRDAVLAPDERGDGGVDVEAAHPHRLEGHHPAERDQRRLGRAAADVDHHVGDRLVDRQRGADGRRHGLLDELRVGGTGPAGRLGDGAPLDLGDGRRHADHHPRAVEPVDADAVQQQPDHALGDLEVGDGALAQRADGHDVARACGRSSATPRGPSPAPLGCAR